MSYNILCMNFRDKRGLVWSSKIIVLLTRLIVKVFETFLNSEVSYDEWALFSGFVKSHSFDYVEIIVEILLKSHIFNAFKGDMQILQCQHAIPLRNSVYQYHFQHYYK